MFLLLWHRHGAGVAECPLLPGAKHKSMLEGHGTQLRRGRGKLLSRAGHKSKRIGNKGSINIQNKAFHCQVCEIYVNSETQLKQVTMPWECLGTGCGCGGTRGVVPGVPTHLSHTVPWLSWLPLILLFSSPAHEQPEAQRQAGREATQAQVQPLQQAAEECCPRSEYSQGTCLPAQRLVCSQILAHSHLGFHHRSSASPLKEGELWWWVLSLFLDNLGVL